MDDQEFASRMDSLEESLGNVNKSIDKVVNSKTNKVYNFLVKLLSILCLVSAIYAGVIGFAGSAAVLAVVFMAFWLMHIIRTIILNAFVSYSEGKQAELKLGRERYK